LINAPHVPSNGLPHHVEPYNLTSFTPAVQKALQKLELLRNDVSIEPIVRRIAKWDSPPERLFYVTFIYLKNSRRIDPKIRIEEQYYIATGGKEYYVDFRLSLADEMYPALAPLFVFVECDSREFHDRTPEEFDKGRERIRELQRQGGKAYPFSGRQLLKNPEKCVIACVKDLQRDMYARREMLMEAFLPNDDRGYISRL
jgi:hypothetical protein